MGAGAAGPGRGGRLRSLPAGEYHRLTVHPGPADPRLVLGFQPMDPARKPPQFKAYPGLEVVPLPRDLAEGGLGRLLFLTAGVVRTLRVPGGPLWFRAAGSAGNLSPIEVYVVSADGVFHYQPVEHGLVRLGDAADITSTSLVLTGVPWRTCWKYRERGFRHLWWDAGTMLANLLAVAPAARVELGFVDAEVAAAVGARAPHELPLAVVSLDGGEAAPGAPGRARPVPAGHLADDPVEFPVVTAAFGAGELATPADVNAWREAYRAAPPPAAPVDFELGEPVDDVIRRRGSCRRFAPGAVAPVELVAGGLPWAAAPARLLEHDVAVFSVVGVDQGAYRLGAAGLQRLRPGGLRGAARHLCLDQGLGGDGSFTVFHCADLERVTAALGDRGYRAAQLEAGLVAGRLHLAAYSRRLGATGLTFYDDEVSRFFATPAAPMLVTAVGEPAYRARPGGVPGRPVEMRP